MQKYSVTSGETIDLIALIGIIFSKHVPPLVPSLSLLAFPTPLASISPRSGETIVITPNTELCKSRETTWEFRHGISKPGYLMK